MQVGERGDRDVRVRTGRAGDLVALTRRPGIAEQEAERVVLGVERRRVAGSKRAADQRGDLGVEAHLALIQAERPTGPAAGLIG